MVVGTDFRIIPVMNGQSDKIVQTTTVRFHHIIHFVYLLFHPIIQNRPLFSLPEISRFNDDRNGTDLPNCLDNLHAADIRQHQIYGDQITIHCNEKISLRNCRLAFLLLPSSPAIRPHRPDEQHRYPQCSDHKHQMDVPDGQTTWMQEVQLRHGIKQAVI